MTAGLDPVAVPPDATAAAVGPRRRGGVGRLLRNPLAVGALLVLAVVVLTALFAPLLAPGSPTHADLRAVLAPPGPEHLLGTDGLGRDVLSRLLYGARTSLVAGVTAVVVAVLVGVPAGLFAGYHLGWFDTVGNWIVNAIIALPGIVVLLVVISAVGANMVFVMAVFGVLISPGFFRITRAATIRARAELYVDAARVSGLSDARIMLRHVLPVVRAPIIIQASMMVGVGISVQSGLAFLGLGSAREASWGAMINDAFANIYGAPGLIFPPGLAIGLTVASFAVLGSALRDALEDDTGGSTSAAPADAHEPSVEATPQGSETVLEIRDLSVRYPGAGGSRTVVSGVTLGVSRGEVLGLVGESGSGKTQTAFAMLGLLPPEAEVSWSSLAFGGEDVRAGDGSALAALRGRRMAYIPQEPMSNLDPSFRIGTQMAEPMRRHLDVSRAEARRRATTLLERVGIRDPERVLAAYPHQISGGMAQRVLIAIAISCNPDVLVADEPTTALDVTVQAEVLDLLRDLQRERQMAVILVTHDFGVVADVCDRVAVMRHGVLVEAGTVTELFGRPQHPYTRMLLASTLEGKEPRQRLLEPLGGAR